MSSSLNVNYFSKEKPTQHIGYRYDNVNTISKSLYELGMIFNSKSTDDLNKTIEELVKLEPDELTEFVDTLKAYHQVIFRLCECYETNNCTKAVNNFLEKLFDKIEKKKI